MAVAGEDLARVTVISPTRRIDLALPGATTLGEIMPNILRFSGYEGGTAADVVHTWVLQRFGEDPLDPTRQIAELDIRDGETLHLRQLEAAMPDVAFDDVVDAVASSTTAQPAWRSGHSVRVALLVTAAFLIGIPLMMLLRNANEPPILRLAEAIATLGLAGAAALAAALASRAFGKLAAATALAWMSVGLGAVGGFFLLDHGLPIQVLTGAACVLLAAGVMGLAARVTPFAFLSAALVALSVIVAEIFAVVFPGNDITIAAVAVALLMGITSLLPPLSFRLARVAMPNLPATAEALMNDETPVQSDIVERAVLADRLLGAFLTATSISVVLGCLQLLPSNSWFSGALVGCIGLSLMLRSRSFVGLGHRLPLLVGGAAVFCLTVVVLLALVPNDVLRLLIGVGIAALTAVILVTYAANYADKITSPVWGRFGDILEWLAILAIVPLVLAVANAYAWALGLAG